MSRSRPLPLLPTVLLALLFAPFLAPTEAPAADRELTKLLRAHDSQGLIRRFGQLRQDDEVVAAREIPVAVAKVYLDDADDYHPRDRYLVFMRAIRELSLVRREAAMEIIAAQVQAGKKWPARAVCLYATIQNPEMDAIDVCLTALTDKSPEVVRASAQALGHSKNALAIPPLIAAMEKWEEVDTAENASKRGRKGLEGSEAGRVWLAIRDSLHRLIGKSLHSAIAYKTYYDAHRDSIDPTKVDLSLEEESTTGLGLFGLELTGRNIVFILDISGSMMSSDPLTPEQIEKLRRTTGVAGDDSLEKAMMEDRRRIVRAKKELTGVVGGLPEDKNFNIIAFSSEVSPWERLLVEAIEKKRKEALAYIAGLEATGITVTDEALQEALADPRIDTIYLITDGAPTHVGLTGPGLPPDSKNLMERILEETRAVNHLRGVRIFTLGFEGAEETFLKKLSEENGGRYVRIE